MGTTTSGGCGAIMLPVTLRDGHVEWLIRDVDGGWRDKHSPYTLHARQHPGESTKTWLDRCAHLAGDDLENNRKC